LPNAVLIDDPMAERRKRSELRRDPVTSRRPESSGAVAGHGSGGTIGSSETRKIMQTLLRNKTNQTRDEDPREALLKYAEESEESPVFVGHVYKDTQPTPIFDETPESEAEAARKVVRRK
jgi:hypothetical protein